MKLIGPFFIFLSKMDHYRKDNKKKDNNKLYIFYYADKTKKNLVFLKIQI